MNARDEKLLGLVIALNNYYEEYYQIRKEFEKQDLKYEKLSDLLSIRNERIFPYIYDSSYIEVVVDRKYLLEYFRKSTSIKVVDKRSLLNCITLATKKGLIEEGDWARIALNVKKIKLEWVRLSKMRITSLRNSQSQSWAKICQSNQSEVSNEVSEVTSQQVRINNQVNNQSGESPPPTEVEIAIGKTDSAMNAKLNNLTGNELNNELDRILG